MHEVIWYKIVVICKIDEVGVRKKKIRQNVENKAKNIGYDFWVILNRDSGLHQIKDYKNDMKCKIKRVSIRETKIWKSIEHILKNVM